MEKKNSVVILVIIFALAIAGLWTMNKMQKSKNSALETNSTENQVKAPVIPKVEISEVANNQLPSDLFKGLPMDNSGKVLVNNNSVSDTGTQYTRRYETAKTLDQSFKLYSDFVKKNSWKVVSSNSTDVVKYVEAKKDGTTMTVNFSQNTLTKKNEVEVIFFVAK